jgi:hypothetical protein
MKIVSRIIAGGEGERRAWFVVDADHLDVHRGPYRTREEARAALRSAQAHAKRYGWVL